MRKVNPFALAAALLLSIPVPGAAAPTETAAATAAEAAAASLSSSFADQLEMLEWSDPERAIQIIDAAPPVSADPASGIDMLEIRGMIYADSSRDDDVHAVERQLEGIADAGDDSAVRAGRFVRAYSA